MTCTHVSFELPMFSLMLVFVNVAQLYGKIPSTLYQSFGPLDDTSSWCGLGNANVIIGYLSH